MMIGVAQVIGMKPTANFFFSSGAAWAKASVAPRTGKNSEQGVLDPRLEDLFSV